MTITQLTFPHEHDIAGCRAGLVERYYYGITGIIGIKAEFDLFH